MIDYETFSDIVREEMDLLPDYVYDELNGGVILSADAMMHPKRLQDDLYILGIYRTDSVMGKQIVLYYGSFAATMGHCGKEQVREQIRRTLRHEFLHHLETRAGLHGRGSLVEEDRENMIRYYMRHRERSQETRSRDSQGGEKG